MADLSGSMKFAASWNHTTKFSTICAMLTLVILPSLLSVWNVPFQLIAITFTIGVIIGVVSWGLGPQDYVVDEDGVKIRRPLEPVHLSRADIVKAKVLTKAEMGVPVRVSGNGGLFGFYGRYYSRRLGWHHWYATRSVDLVGVKSATLGWIVLSPDDREGFVEAVNRLLPVDPSTIEDTVMLPALGQSGAYAAYLKQD